ncbi:MAG: hypothetical protein GXP56_19490 [Deltaproteobacteria bacterium]|nr:hypothetical protein [Deltaproteobacteria bacterium]
MKKTCSRYTPEKISRFVDNELSQDQYYAVSQHIIHCPDCNRLAGQYKSLSAVFNDHADQQKLQINPDRLRQKLLQNTPCSKKNLLGNILVFFSKNIYLQLASIAVILIICLFSFQGSLFGPTGPSAIVTSVDTDFTSVMIIETQKEKHTIIWFSET